MIRPAAALAALLLPAAPAAAQALRELCTERPGVGLPACTVDPGHVQVELGLGDWTLDRQPDKRSETLLVGDTRVRIGVAEATEIALGWTALGHVRERDRMTGRLETATGVGDVAVALKQNLVNPAGDRLSVAVLGEASLPVGREPVGAGDWGARLLIPVDYALTDSLRLHLMPEADAAVDEDGDGRHLAYGGVVGVSLDLGEAVTAALEGQAMRDRDPGGHETTALAAVSLAWRPKERIQFDIGANAGLNRAAPGIEVYLGVSEKF